MSVVVVATDDELLKKVKAKDAQAFETLLQRYSAKVFHLAARFTKNDADAEEVLQDVWVTVYRKLSGFEGKSSFSSWLYRVTVNAALMKIRSKKEARSRDASQLSEIEHSEHCKDHAPAIDLQVENQELSAKLSEAISKLPDHYRPVFILRDIDGFSSIQVGKMLQISIPAVKSRLHRSRMILRRRLEPMLREWGMTPKVAGNM